MARIPVRGVFTRLNGSPDTGTIVVTTSRKPLQVDGEVISGPQSFPVASNGTVSFDLPVSDDPVNGEAWHYNLRGNLSQGTWVLDRLSIPVGTTEVDLSNPPSGVQRMYPTRQEWDALVATMVDHFDTASAIADQAAARATQAAKEATSDVHLGLSWNGAVELGELALTPNTLHTKLTGNTTVTLPTPAEGSPAHTVTVIVSQDTTGGHSLSLPEVAWAWAVPAVPHQAPGARTVIHLWWNGLTWDGFVAGPNMGYGAQGGI